MSLLSSDRFSRSLSPRRGLWPAFAITLLLFVLSLAPQAAHSQTSPWTPVDFAIHPYDGGRTSRLLWKNTNGKYALWNIDSALNVTKGLSITPESGYTIKQIATKSGGYTIILWDNPTARKISLWRVSPDFQTIIKTPITYPNSQYAPGSINFHDVNDFGFDDIMLSWNLTNGTCVIWEINAITGSIDLTTNPYGPIAGYTAGDIVCSSNFNGSVNNFIYITWVNPTKTQVKLTVIPGVGSISHTFSYGPYSGVTFKHLTMGNDGNPQFLWEYSTGKIALWGINGNTGAIYKSALQGPVSGVAVVGVGLDAGSFPQVLWKYADGTGKAAHWILSQQWNTTVLGKLYGPVK